ncbi:MAG: cyclic nucleotide-binding domain-containing protein, partial [Deltaproteobacteria bacterium]|nr:cyclic nucleotide-binding domain-containing protein [Deltaproteobacteria bacterium]
MDYIQELVEREGDKATVLKVLTDSLKEKDPYCTESRKILGEMGFAPDCILMLLAHHKSSVKYGYTLASNSISRILNLAKMSRNDEPLSGLVECPIFLVKACWIYEHAPFFYFYGDDKPEACDALVLEYAERYASDFLNNRVDISTWGTIRNPKRIIATTFWESKIIDPLLLIARAKGENISGVELCFDFHPFNYTKMLPEEVPKYKREQIKAACIKSGIKIDIHSPIIGPYTPSPDPSKGKQRFFDPAKSLEVQYEIVELAKDIGAGAVVLHLIDNSNLKPMADLVEKAGGSDVRVTIENYCQIKNKQTSERFIACLDEIFNALPRDIRANNFGVTLDVGHLNIEGEDPLVGAERIGKWCLENKVFLRMHATDNYGDLLFSPPAYSADVHSNISGRGINNALIIKMLRSMGHQFEVVGEQILPLTPEDIETVHGAQSFLLDETFESLVKKGEKELSGIEFGALIEPHIVKERAYRFLAGLEGVSVLKEYLIFRRIQEKKHLSVDEAKRISQEYVRMPKKVKADLTKYVDDLLLPIQAEAGAIQKSELDSLCQNISGAMYGGISNEHLNQIFGRDRTYRKGNIICEQGSVAKEMYYLKDGEVTVFVEGAVVATLGTGEIFGEISLFYNINKSATIKVSSETATVGALTRESLESLFMGDHAYAHDLIYRLFSILPERLRNLNDKYKMAIRSLHLIFDGDEEKMPSVNHEQMDGDWQKSSFFPSLSQKDKEKIYQEIKNFDADETVFKQGDQGDGAYIILEGKVKVVGVSSDLEEILLGELDEGELFGEMSLIDDKPR